MYMKRILDIEDDLLSHAILKKFFKNEYVIDVCTSGEDFYKSFSNIKYDLLLIDIGLSGNKSGLDLIKEIKQNPSYPKTPIICLTASAEIELKKKAIEYGADMHIIKPIIYNHLKENIEELIRMYSN